MLNLFIHITKYYYTYYYFCIIINIVNVNMYLYKKFVYNNLRFLKFFN